MCDLLKSSLRNCSQCDRGGRGASPANASPEQEHHGPLAGNSKATAAAGGEVAITEIYVATAWIIVHVATRRYRGRVLTASMDGQESLQTTQQAHLAFGPHGRGAGHPERVVVRLEGDGLFGQDESRRVAFTSNGLFAHPVRGGGWSDSWSAANGRTSGLKRKAARGFGEDLRLPGEERGSDSV